MQTSAHQFPEVSSDNEMLILVDSQDNVVGHAPKGKTHDGVGVLHRAFSVFLFDEQGRVLLQQRAAGKRLWPGFWANSVCSHPRQGEELVSAAKRRIFEELGVVADLTPVFSFEYHATYLDKGSEHELCHVLVGNLVGAPRYNPNEIAAIEMVPASEVEARLASTPDAFTPWLKLEWPKIAAHLKRV